MPIQNKNVSFIITTDDYRQLLFTNYTSGKQKAGYILFYQLVHSYWQTIKHLYTTNYTRDCFILLNT